PQHGGTEEQFLSLICKEPSYLSRPNIVFLRSVTFFPLTAGCSQYLDPGPCRDYVMKWYYDATSNSCAQFWFGGCQGNQNRFDTEKKCRETCVKV
uniref:BPTI/Kunitz inhibitor domain-containing protein n=1 Tax=Poecilia latipinna TaxID=48699 RepID=A0A3B3VJ40_9TELE